ncbi:rcsF protein [Colwellia sp. BRX8-7]|uniref:Rcs stress response system protein RcsF n=1 Tax=Colwellia sp. BRX8-7 TaxID=2759833 RepID=UPI0015F5C29B|nr:Rcs stress response system protein RcsF [Colwellia sp. BRX8-7]MBA6336088.1 rcsF protein [Colwellia sp. BRX8-7]
MKKISKINNRLILILTLTLIGLSACSSQYTVSTNLDKGKFQTYFSHAQVKVFQDESEFSGRFKLIGLVEGEDCQAKSHHALPDKIAARTEARRQAAQQQANAIIFSGCALIDDDQANKQCIATLVCYGMSFQVEPLKKIN